MDRWEVPGMIEKRWSAFELRRKSQLVIYLLWLFLGLLGGYRFYLGMKPSGIAMACLACVSAVTWCVLWETPDEALLASTVTAVPLLVWVLSDIFRLPGFVRDYNDRLIRWVGGDLMRRRPRRDRYGRTWMARR